MVVPIIRRVSCALRGLRRTLQHCVAAARSLFGGVWNVHERLMRTSPAYDAVIVGALIELARLRRAAELGPIVVSALLGVGAVLAQRRWSHPGHTSGPLLPDWP